MKNILITILSIMALPLKMFSAEAIKQMKEDFVGNNVVKSNFQMSCITITDDLDDGVNCPMLTPGAKGTFKLIEYFDVDNFGTINATTNTYTTDITLKPSTSWKTHDTDDDFAKIVFTGIEGSGQYETVISLFYSGNKADRHVFFENAFKKNIKFTIGFTTNDGLTYILKKAKIVPIYDSKLATDTTANGWTVTFKQKGELPFIYEGAFI